MSAPELTFSDIARRLRADEAVLEPSSELWPRIVAAHEQRRRRTRWQRYVIGTAGLLVLVAISVLIGSDRTATAVDWQARAQALELQLRAAQGDGPAHAFNTNDAQNELVRLDGVLQAAYDDGAEATRIDALWKRRSELLDALIKARRENMDISRI